MSAERDAAILKLARAAVDAEWRTGFPAEVLFAQAAIESRYLQSAPGNNPFGIKFVPGRHKSKQLLRTREWFAPEDIAPWLMRQPGRSIIREEGGPDARGRRLYVVKDWFAAYESLEEAIADYVRLLTRGRYEEAWREYQQTRDWRRLMHRIAEAGYATAPDYARVLLSVLDDRAIAALSTARAQHGGSRDV